MPFATASITITLSVFPAIVLMDLKGKCPSFDVPKDFKVSNHRADVFGTCPNCQTQTEMEPYQ